MADKAASRAGLHVPIYVIRFPGNGHRAKYVERLAAIVRVYVPART